MNYFLRVYKSDVANTKISLKTPISIHALLGNLNSEHTRNIAKPCSEYTSLYFWDLGVRASKFINAGDILFIATKNDLYFSEVTMHIKDQYGRVGDAIGWSLQYGNSWKNPLAFQSVIHTPITSKIRSLITDVTANGIRLNANFYQLKNKLSINAEGTTEQPDLQEVICLLLNEINYRQLFEKSNKPENANTRKC